MGNFNKERQELSDGQKILQQLERTIEEINELKIVVVGSKYDDNSGLISEFRSMKNFVTKKFDEQAETIDELKKDVLEIKNYHKVGGILFRTLKYVGSGIIAIIGVVKWNDFLHLLGIK